MAEHHRWSHWKQFEGTLLFHILIERSGRALWSLSLISATDLCCKVHQAWKCLLLFLYFFMIWQYYDTCRGPEHITAPGLSCRGHKKTTFGRRKVFIMISSFQWTLSNVANCLLGTVFNIWKCSVIYITFYWRGRVIRTRMHNLKGIQVAE